MTIRPRTKFSNVIIVALVLLIGLASRSFAADVTSFKGDEAWVAFLAFSWGHNGQRQDVGQISSTGLPQSLFIADIFAIPFSFDPDVQIARLFNAGLQLVSMAVLYMLVRRYWSERTALATLILYVVMPRAVWAGSQLWNPYLAMPFVIFFLATGFLASEGKTWGRRLHFVMLCAGVQSHPIVIIAAPLSLLFIARDWSHTKPWQRWRLGRDYAIGAIVAGLLLVPWIVSLIYYSANNPSHSAIARLSQTSSPAQVLNFLIDSPTRLVYKVPPNPSYVAPSGYFAMALQAIGWFTLLAGLFLVGRAVLKRRFADLVIGLAYLIIPTLLLMFPERTYDHYLLPALPAAAIIQAIILVGTDRLNKQWLRVGTIVIAVLCVLQIAVIVNVIQQSYTYTVFNRDYIPALPQMSKFRDEAVRPGHETIYLLEGSTDTEFTQAMMWLVLGGRRQGAYRVIWGSNMALPVPHAGATYIGFTDATHIPELYANVPSRVTVGNVYKAVDLPPNSAFTPTCKPQGPVRLANGATILGYFAPSARLPGAGQPWTIYLLWQGQPNNTHQTYQIFNHLVDAKGEKYSQNDISSLPTDLWHDDEQLVSRVVLTPNDKLTEGKQLYLRVGMYTLPNAKGVSALDDDGNPVASWVTVPICRATTTF